jgi:hypothetical protein
MMNRLMFPVVAAAAAGLAEAALPGRAPPVDGCRFHSAPHVVIDEPGALLQYWIEEDRPELHGTGSPASPSLFEFRERITRSLDTEARSVLERQLPHARGGDWENLRLVLDGEAGSTSRCSGTSRRAGWWR